MQMIAGILVVLLVSAVPTLHSVLNDGELVHEPALLGEWQAAGEPDRWQFTAGREPTYGLQHISGDETGSFRALLGRFDDLLILEVQPHPPEGVARVQMSKMLPVRSFFVVEQMEPTLKISTMKADWLGQHLEDNPDDLKHAVMRGRVVLTAPTDDMQAFIVKHRDTPEAWRTVELQRPNDAEE